MKILILTALIAAVVASVPRSEESNGENQAQWPYQVGKLYRYDVESYTLARYHDREGQSSGSVFKARLILRAKAPGRILAKLENFRHAVVHQEMPKPPQEMALPGDLKYEPVPNMDQPFEISLKGGRVVSLNLPSSLSVSHENLLKGLISALQVDLSTYRTVHHAQNNYDRRTQQGQFRKMETDVTGDCETLYTVLPVAAEWRRELPKFHLTNELTLSEEPMEITKSKNYGHCHHRVSYHFGVPQGAEWTGTAHNIREEQFIKRSTISRILATRQGPIFKAETTSTVEVHPHLYGKQKADVLSQVKLQLDSHEQDNEGEWSEPEAKRFVKNLLYSMTSKQMDIKDQSSESHEHDQSAQVEDFQNRVRRSVRAPRKFISINKVIIKRNDDSNADSSKDSSSAYINDDIPNNNEPAHAALYMQPEVRADKKQNPIDAQKLVQEMAQQLQSPNNMPKNDFLSKFNILVRVIAAMSSEQLSQTSRSIEVAKSSNNIVKSDMWMIYRDAVAQAGTLPAFKQIQSWIKNKKIQGEEAAEVVATLANTLRYPTKEAMSEFFNLAMSAEVSQQKYLNSTALIAATRFINMGQVNNDTAHSYYPTHMYGRLARKHDNFVLEEILPRIRQALEQAIQQGDSKKAQVYIKAIGNLGHRAILDVYAPYLEGKIPVSTYLRALMVENFHILALQQDKYARAVLYNILRNTAEPYEVRVAAIHKILVSHPTSAMMQAMAHMTKDDPSVQVRAVLKSSIESIAESRSPFFLNLARSAQVASPMLTKQTFGKQYSAKYFNDYFDNDYELGITSVLSYTGSEDNLFPKFLKYSLRSRVSGWNAISASFSSVQHFVEYLKQHMGNMWMQKRQSEHNHKYPAEKISQLLNIKPESQDPLEAAFYINLMNQQRYFTLSEDDLKQLPNTMRQFFSDLASGVEAHYTKVLNQAQVSVMFPVAMGMPFIYKYKEPTVVHIQVKAKGETTFAKNEQEEFSANIVKEIQFTFARNIDGQVGFLDTIANKYASVGVINKVQVNIPVKVQTQMKPGQVKIHFEPLHHDQETTIAHFSVWPYSANQKKDTLVTISQDPTTKPISRSKKIASFDSKLGQAVGTQFHIQGYSYSSDYTNLGTMFKSPDLLSNIALAIYQRDIALTHYNIKYLGKQSQNKGVTISAAFDEFYNLKENAQGKLAASNMEDVTPNSEARRQEIFKRVASGINTAKAQVVDLSAIFEGTKKSEYVLTAAMAGSPVDPKIQYAFFAGWNLPELGNNQINGVLTANKPPTFSMNYKETLDKLLSMKFEADIKFGQDSDGNVNVQGLTERSAKYVEDLKNQLAAKLCDQEMTNDNYYQQACHKMLVMAHAHDHLTAAVSYKNVSPEFKYFIYQAYKIAEYYGFWYTEVNPLRTTRDGQLDIEVWADHLEKSLNLRLKSRYGEVNAKNIPIPKVSAGAVSIYAPFKVYERVANYYTRHQYKPYCTVDGKKIKTFSHRSYDYTMTSSWHVVIQDEARPEYRHQKDELVVLARRFSKTQLETYISYISENGDDFEMDIKAAPEGSNKPNVRVSSKAKKVSDGDLTMYWDESEQAPLLQYYTQPDGTLMLTIREDRFRAMYDGQRLVVITSETRNNTRGICGHMSGDARDDYLTPYGIVDQPKHYAPTFALLDGQSDPKTQELQLEAKQQMSYQPENKYTTILRSDKDWQNSKSEESSEEKQGSENVYRSRGYLKQRGSCELQEQVQYYENHGEICITTMPLDACPSHCSGEDYKVQAAQVVCRPKLEQKFQQYRNQIRQGQNPQVSGVPEIKQFRVPTSCNA